MSTTAGQDRLAGKYVSAAKLAASGSRPIVEASIEGGLGGRPIP